MSDDLNITPSPPAWKDPKIQTLDRLVQQYENAEENLASILKQHAQMESKAQSYSDEEKINESEQTWRAFDEVTKSRTNTLHKIVNALASTHDSNALSEWVIQYIQTTSLQNNSNIFGRKSVDEFPAEFIQQLNSNAANAIYQQYHEFYTDEYIERKFPGILQIL